MKKLVMMTAVLAMAIAAHAQLGGLTVSPKMQKGLVKEFLTEETITFPGQGDLQITEEDKYTVVEETATGYVLEVVTTKYNSKVDEGNIAGKIMAGVGDMMKGLKLQVAVDKNGVPTELINKKDVAKKLDARTSFFVKKLFSEIPMLAQAMQEEDMQKNLLQSLNDSTLLTSLTESNSAMALNGKSIMTGAQEDYMKDGMKMKRMYFVTGNKVTANGSLNMTMDDIKATILEKVEKEMPEQASMIKDNIDQLIQGGMLKIDSKETTNYELGDDGWVKNLTGEATIENVGQQMTTKVTITEKVKK